MATSKYKSEDLHLGVPEVHPYSNVPKSHPKGGLEMFLDFLVVLLTIGVCWLIAEVIVWLIFN